MAEAAAIVSSTAPKLFEAKRRGGGGGDNNAWEKRTCTGLLHRQGDDQFQSGIKLK